MLCRFQSRLSSLGRPLTSRNRRETGQIGIKQSRYLSSGDVEGEEDATTWWIPLGK